MTVVGTLATALWHEPSELCPQFDADVVIVGAGYTGLWAVYYLLASDPHLRVTLLEREHIGFGASGRNGGWVSTIFPMSLDRVAKASSHSDRLRLQTAMNDTVDEIGRVLDEARIAAECTKNGLALSCP